MKYKKLIIHNIASIENAEIDFEGPQLLSKPIFLICGDTGAGKTTILDSICLALFGDTPRMCAAAGGSYDSSGDRSITFKDPRQLLSRGAGEGYASLSFLGNDGREYISVWRVRRARGRADGALQNVIRTLEDVESGMTYEKARDIDAIIRERLLGQSMDEFCRTSMLAQGEFSKFLSSNENEKAAILEKLTGTEKFADIGRGIYARWQDCKNRLEQAQALCDGIHCMTEEEITQQNRLLEDFRAQASAAEKLSQEYSDMVTKLDDLKARNQEKQRIDGQDEALKSEFASFIMGINVLNQNVASLDLKNSMLKKELESMEPLREMLEDEGAIVEKLRSYSQEVSAKKTAEGLALQLSSELKPLEETLAKEKSERDCVAQAVETAGQALLLSREKLASMDRPGKDAELKSLNHRLLSLSDIIAHYDQLSDSFRRVSGCRSKISQLDEELEKSAAHCATLEQSDALARENEAAALAFYQNAQRMVDDWPKEQRALLKVGDRCPLCGQTIQEELHEDDFVSALAVPRSAYEESRMRARNSASEYAAAKGALSEKTNSRSAAALELSREENRHASLQRKYSELCQAASLEVTEIEAVRQMKSECEEKTAALAQMIADIDAFAAEVSKKQSDKDSLADKLAKADEMLHKQEAGINDLKVRIEAERVKASVAQANMDAHAESLRGRIKYDDYRGLSTEALIIRIQKDAESLRSQTETLRNNEIKRESQNEVLGRCLSWINRMRGEHAGWEEVNPQELRECPDMDGRLLDLSGRESSLRTTAKACADSISALETAVSAFYDSHETKDELSVREAYKGISAQIADINLKMAEVMSALKNDGENKRKFEALLQEVRKLSEVSLRWEELNSAFGDATGSKFRRIAQSFILSGLVERANHYLHMLSPRYELDTKPGTLTILVRDLYAGGVESAGNTLSGGESFIASLSLALALSGMGNEENSFGVNTLFIDEGFGTLSGEPLGNVMDVLHQLHGMGGKQVGLISHVAALRDEIRTQIRVKRKADGIRSSVEVVG